VAGLSERLQRFIDDPALAGRMAARAPRVKRIEDDAGEWEARYEVVTRSRALAVSV
jgi:hypothetical protein